MEGISQLVVDIYLTMKLPVYNYSQNKTKKCLLKNEGQEGKTSLSCPVSAEEQKRKE
jgi:hypothetical protein